MIDVSIVIRAAIVCGSALAVCFAGYFLWRSLSS